MTLYERLIAKAISCPECRGEMQEVHRAQENGILFIWLECADEHCMGQWLQKLPVASNSLRAAVDNVHQDHAVANQTL